MLLSKTKIQKRGTVTIPAQLRQKWGLEVGSEVVFEDTEAGILIRRASEAEILQAIELVGQELKKRGVTFEELMERGEQVREELYQERYGRIGS